MYQVRAIFWHNRWSGWTASRINPNETFEVAKKETKYTLLETVVGERKNFLTLPLKYAQSPRNCQKSLCPTVLQLRWVYMVRWKYESVCIFSMLWDTLGLILWKKADKKCKDQKRSIFFAKGTLIEKSIFQIQRINAVHGRCSRSDVLRDIPSNFTRSVRQRIVLCK